MHSRESARPNFKRGGGSKPDPLAFLPGVCSGGYLFSSGGPTPTLPPANFYPAADSRSVSAFSEYLLVPQTQESEVSQRGTRITMMIVKCMITKLF